MADTHYKTYLKHLAFAVQAFWSGETEKSIELITQADSELDISVGKHISQRLQSSLEGYLKHWRKQILNSSDRQSIKNPIPHSECIREINPLDDFPQETSLSYSEPVQVETESKISQINLRTENQIKSPEPEQSNFPENIIQEIIRLYKDDRFGEAVRELEKLKKTTKIELFEHPIIREIENDYKDVKEIFEGIADSEGWAIEDTGKITVKYKNIPGTATYTILTESEIDVPIFNFITLMYETDLYHTWIPFCKKSTAVAKLSRTRKIVFQEFHVPLIATRQTCVYGFGVNMLTTDGVVAIASRSCDQESHFKGVRLPGLTKIKRAYVNIMGCIVRPLSLEKIHATIITNFDPNISIPYKFLNYFSRKLAKGMFKKIVKKAKNFEGSEFQKRVTMEENKEFYEFLAKTQDEYLSSLSNK